VTEDGSVIVPGDDLDDELDEDDIAALLDEADAVDVVEMSEVELKKLVIGMERNILNNQRLRLKYAEDPPKFMESEVGSGCAERLMT
jgi:Catenin-beta-like, Arm-motif containing nuclear